MDKDKLTDREGAASFKVGQGFYRRTSQVGRDLAILAATGHEREQSLRVYGVYGRSPPSGHEHKLRRIFLGAVVVRPRGLRRDIPDGIWHCV